MGIGNGDGRSRSASSSTTTTPLRFWAQNGSDIVDAILVAANSDRSSEFYNVGSGKTVSVNRLVELLGGEKVYIPKRPGEPDCTFADITRIQSDLHWEPKVSIEDGVDNILENIEYWREAPVWNPESIADATKDWFRYLGSQN